MQRHYFAEKCPLSQSYGFSSSQVGLWELNQKEGWVPENQCFWTVVLEKTLESSLDNREIKPVNLKGDQLWIFIGRMLKLQYCGHLIQSADSLEKTLMLGKTEGRRRRGWQRSRWLDDITNNRHDFEQALGDGEGQGDLVCCSLWGCKESDATEQLNKGPSGLK